MCSPEDYLIQSNHGMMAMLPTTILQSPASSHHHSHLNHSQQQQQHHHQIQANLRYNSQYDTHDAYNTNDNNTAYNTLFNSNVGQHQSSMNYAFATRWLPHTSSTNTNSSSNSNRPIRLAIKTRKKNSLIMFLFSKKYKKLFENI